MTASQIYRERISIMPVAVEFAALAFARGCGAFDPADLVDEAVQAGLIRWTRGNLFVKT
jgi:hypothetical protein